MNEPLAPQRIPFALITESPSNPRTHFDEQKLAELAESIARFGVLQPILVRPAPGKKKGLYELVAGHRRFRAARSLPLEGGIPAIVQELTDVQVLEVQIIENLQREGLHPLEEAEGYARLIREHAYDADSLGLKIGKSRSYVYARMKLAALCEPAKKALWDGTLSHSVALLIARIPDARLQASATKVLVGSGGVRGEMTYREAEGYIQQNYMLRLDEAPFDTKNATLVRDAGPCTTCPLRAGNQPELYPDVKNADVCTSPSCHQKKVAAHLALEAKAKGWKTLPAKDVKEVFSYGAVRYSGPYVDSEAQAGELGNYSKKYKDVVPKTTPVYLAVDDRGKVHQLYAKADLPKRQVASRANPSANNRWKRDQEGEKATREALFDALAVAVTLRPPEIATLLPFLAQEATIERPHDRERIAKLLGVKKVPKGYAKPDLIVSFVEALKPGEQLSLLVLSLFGAVRGSGDGEVVADKVFRLLGVDRKAVMAKVTADLKTRWDAQDAKKKGAKKKEAKKAAKKKAPKKKAVTVKPPPAPKKRPGTPPIVVPKKKAAKPTQTCPGCAGVGLHDGDLYQAAPGAPVLDPPVELLRCPADCKQVWRVDGVPYDPGAFRTAGDAERAAPVEPPVALDYEVFYQPEGDGDRFPYLVRSRKPGDEEWTVLGRKYRSVEAAKEKFPDAWLRIDAPAGEVAIEVQS